MKKIFLIAFFVSLFTNCTKNSFETDFKEQQRIISEAIEKNYNDAFINVFGIPSENQQWGFNSRILPSTFNYTRSANVEGNIWYKEWERPTNITEEEIAWAKNEFSKVRKGASHSEQITWENYWVQQVYQGKRASKNGEGNDVLPKNAMNKLLAFNTLKENVISWWPKEVEYVEYEGSYEHINNFNSANNTTVYTDESTKEKFIGTTLMTHMKSDGRNEQFGYHNTSDSKNHYEYIIIEHNGSYFIGFDLFADGSYIDSNGIEQNKNKRIDRDWIFDDWIVKITKAKRVNEAPNRYSVRIIGEDLSVNDKSDFDFNDVVFDASYSEGIDKTFIKLQACGGTLPLYVEGKEVHKLFAEKYPNVGIIVDEINSNNTMINTNAKNGISGLDGVDFVIDRIIAPWDIEIRVRKNGILLPLKAETSSPASKIAVDLDFKWCDEQEPILRKYPNFKNYVQDTSVEWY